MHAPPLSSDGPQSGNIISSDGPQSGIIISMSSECHVNFVSPNITKSILKISNPLVYSERQLIETLTNSQLKANLTVFRLSNNVPQAYGFVFTTLELFDYHALLYKKKNIKYQREFPLIL